MKLLMILAASVIRVLPQAQIHNITDNIRRQQQSQNIFGGYYEHTL